MILVVQLFYCIIMSNSSMVLKWVPNGDSKCVMLMCPEDRGFARVTVKIQIGNSQAIIPLENVRLQGQVPVHTFRDETEGFDPHNDLFMVVLEGDKFEPHSLTLENTNACNFCLSAEAMLQCVYSRDNPEAHGWIRACHRCLIAYVETKGTTPGCTNGKPCRGQDFRGNDLPCKWESCQERHAFFPSKVGTKADRFWQGVSPYFVVTDEFVEKMHETCGVRCKKQAFEFTYSGSAILQQKMEDSNTRGSKPSGLLVKQDNEQDTCEIEWPGWNPIVYAKASTGTIWKAAEKWGAKDLFDRSETTGEMECHGEAMSILRSIAWSLHTPTPCIEFYGEPDDNGKRVSYIVFISPNEQLPGLCGINYDPVTEQYYWYVLDFTSYRSVVARRTDVLWNKSGRSAGKEKSAAARTTVSTFDDEGNETYALFSFHFIGNEDFPLVRVEEESTKTHAVFVAECNHLNVGGSEQMGVIVNHVGGVKGKDATFRARFLASGNNEQIQEGVDTVTLVTGTTETFNQDMLISLDEGEDVCTLAYFKVGKDDPEEKDDTTKDPEFKVTLKRKYPEKGDTTKELPT